MNKINFRILAVLLLFPLIVHAQLDDEPLAPDQAFNLSVSTIDANTIRAEWKIVDGYYLYRTKFKFSTDTAGIMLQDPSFPPGKIKKDEFFGNVETYRHSVAVDIPIKREDPSVNVIKLTAISQGCADIGVCYPPQTQIMNINLPPAPTTSLPAESSPALASGFSALKKLGESLGLTDSDDKFLEADQAFAFTSDVADGNTIKARWDIAKGYYLYRDKFKFELKDANGIKIGNVNMPRGQTKEDESFGKMEIYHNLVELNIPLVRTGSTSPMPVTLVAKYQGCAEAGFCYPPQTKTVSLSLPPSTGSGSTTITPPASTEKPIAISEQDQIAATLAGGNKILTILSFFGFGLLLAFTPCVFPMIPILSSIIVGQGEKVTTRKAFTLSLVYVLAMAVTYTIAGVIAGMFGENLQAAFQNPWILGTFAGIFVLLSFSMFGFYDLQVPSFLQSKFTEISNKQQGGTLVGVGVMGFLSALIVGPCVAAPLAGALIYIGQTGDAVLGGVALFALSMGMGAPLLAIGTSAGNLLPRAGDWMDTIKAVFGVLLIGVAIWMLDRILPPSVTMMMWAALLIISAIYMGALEPYGAGATGWRKFWKGSGLVMMVYGTVLIIGAASGGRDYLQPLQGITMGMAGTGSQSGTSQEKSLKFIKVKGSTELNQALAKAGAQGKPVMLDFYADWCVSCKEMEKYTFSNPEVRKVLSQAVLLQADVTANDTMDKELLKRFKLIGPPSMLFFGPDGKERRSYRLVGFLEADQFSGHAKQALGL